MTILPLLTIVALSGGLSGYIMGIVASHYSLGGLANAVFGILGGMACLHLLGAAGVTLSAEGLSLADIALHVACGIAGGAVLAMVAGFVQKTA